MEYPTGFPQAIDYKQPRSFFKLTSQLTPDTNLTMSLEVDTYNGVNRDGSVTVTPEATVSQKSPEAVGNFSLTHIISPASFFDVKGAYFWGYYYLDPTTGKDLHTHLDLNTNNWLYNSGYFYYADRSRLQVNASYTHFAEDFIQGNHDFKFGVEVERSGTRSRYGYTGSGQDAIFGNTGLPFTQFNDYLGYEYAGPLGQYLAYQYEGYDKNSPYTRLEGFAQDSWQITSRLNLNLGVRLSQNWGYVKDVEGAVYNTFRIAPRLGFTYDILGDKTTVFKAHYGQYTEGMFASYHDRMNPSSAFKDAVSYYWDTGADEWVEFSRTVYEQIYSMADNIKHPYMNQFVVGIERELFKDTSFSVNYINRKWNDLIGLIDLQADYAPVTVTVPDLNDQQYQVFERTEETVDTHEYVIANIKKGDPWIGLDPYRKYWGLRVRLQQALLQPLAAPRFLRLFRGEGDDRQRHGRRYRLRVPRQHQHRRPEFLDQRRGQPDRRPDAPDQAPGHLHAAVRDQLQRPLSRDHGECLDHQVPDVAAQPGAGDVLRRAAGLEPLRDGQPARPQAGEDLHHSEPLPARDHVRHLQRLQRRHGHELGHEDRV